jgi:hydrogenase maturation protease
MISLQDILKKGKKVVVLCLGNIERGDDGAGPRLARAIKGRVSYEVIDAGVTPENYTGVIKRSGPDTIVIVDAVWFDGRPGETRVFFRGRYSLGKGLYPRCIP